MKKIGVITSNCPIPIKRDHDSLGWKIINNRICLFKGLVEFSAQDYDLIIIDDHFVANFQLHERMQILDYFMGYQVKLIMIMSVYVKIKPFIDNKWFPLEYDKTGQLCHDPFDIVDHGNKTIQPKWGSTVLVRSQYDNFIVACSPMIAVCHNGHVSVDKLIEIFINGIDLSPALMYMYPVKTRRIIGTLFYVVKALRVKIPRPIIWIIINLWYFN